MGKKPVVTPAMLEEHRKANPPPKPLYAEIDVVIERTIEVATEFAESRMLMLRELFPGCSDSEIVQEVVDDFLIRMGAV